MKALEEKILKMNILGGMDTYIREVIGDEDLIDEWNMYGVPGEATEDDLASIATNEAEWRRICVKFGQIVHFAD